MLRTILVAGALLCAAPAVSRDLGQFGNSNPAIALWFRGLMQPDYPESSCCGPADAYEADVWTANADGSIEATVTSNRGSPINRVGQTIHVPANKVQARQGNPVGHAVVFISPVETNYVFCFVPGGGV